ncbi:MAG: glycosyltransferase family 4 protein [Candidatus Thiosymbion ectosymbiont of Robbea hypermnestra]|nr:glycosyltransferase family 4 protein [Candidatus Thiosymbion ectosymbiont of Robbea hypermnestra]
MMVVPQYPYPIVGGLERQAHELARVLRESGVSVQALSGRVDGTQPDLEMVDGVSVHRIPWSPRKWLRFLRTPGDLLRVLYAQRGTCDVVHLHQFSWFGLFTIVTARLLGKPILTKLPNVREAGIPGLLAQRFGRLKLALLTRSDGLVAMSQESLDELRHIGYPAGRILTTPNGIRLSSHRPVGTMEEPQSQTACKVVFVGRLAEEKRLDTLFTAWRKVVDVVTAAAVLELWGSGPLLAGLQGLCLELGVSDSVVFRGHLDKVRDRLGTMDVFVLPSHLEGNSNAVLEAMDAGLPVVSTRVGGTPMLVGPEGASLLFDVGDEAALARHLITLIQSPALRRRFGAAMRCRAETHFDIRKVARTYGTAYRYLSEGRRDRLSEVGRLPGFESHNGASRVVG